MAVRKPFLLRLEQRTFDAIQQWAADDLRSINAQIEFLLRRELTAAHRLRPSDPSARRGQEGGQPKADTGS